MHCIKQDAIKFFYVGMLIPLNYSSFEVSYPIPQSQQTQSIFNNSQSALKSCQLYTLRVCYER